MYRDKQIHQELKTKQNEPKRKVQEIPFVDNRPEAIAQMKMQKLANTSLQVTQMKAYQALTTGYTSKGKIVQRVLDDDQLSPAWEKVEAHAKKVGVVLSEDNYKETEKYFAKKKTPSSATDALPGAILLINKWIKEPTEEKESLASSKKKGWQKGPKTGLTGRLKSDGEHHTSKGAKHLSRAERNRRRDRERRQFGEGGGGRFAE